MKLLDDVLLIVAALGMIYEIAQEIRHNAPKTSALAGKKRQIPLLFATISLFWIALTGYLAYSGWLENTVARPPRLLFLLIPPFVTVLWLGFSRVTEPLLRVVKPERLIVAQSFRLLMEVALFLLFLQQEMAGLLTVEGRNFDLLIPLSIPVVLALYRHTPFGSRFAVYWNLVGFALAVNVGILEVVSAPGAFQTIRTHPPFAQILHFPYIWLPTFFVPLAMLLHLLSLRQLVVIKKVFEKPFEVHR